MAHPLQDADAARETLLTMWTTRRFEEAVDDLFARGLMHGTMHLSIGQEAVRDRRLPRPCATTTRSPPPTAATATASPRAPTWCAMMAELLAKETGYCRGRGGSMHIADVATGNLGANGIVGGGIPIAAGRGAAPTSCGARTASWPVFFGDGAANEGAFHEALNLAAIWDLPVVFICENNKYGMSFSTEKAFAIENISERAAAYGIPGVTVDGNDVEAVYDAVGRGRRPRPRAATVRPSSRASPTAGRATARATRTSTAPARRSRSGAATTRSCASRRRCARQPPHRRGDPARAHPGASRDMRLRRTRGRTRPRRTPSLPTCSTPSTPRPEENDPT